MNSTQVSQPKKHCNNPFLLQETRRGQPHWRLPASTLRRNFKTMNAIQAFALLIARGANPRDAYDTLADAGYDPHENSPERFNIVPVRLIDPLELF